MKQLIKVLKVFNIKFYLLLIKMLFVIFVIIGFLQFDIALTNQKYKYSLLKEKLQTEKVQNRYRIDQISQVAQKIGEIYPAVGQAVEDILVDLKEDNMLKIDQKISDLPEEMQEMIIYQHINLYSVKNYKLFDEDYIIPTDLQTSYIPARYGEFGWRPKLFDENNAYKYVYQQSIKNGHWVMHNANDIVSPYNPEILASNDGLIIKIGYNERGGKYIWIEHRFENKPVRQTRYYHLSEINVEEGQYVKKGEIIGYIGNTGKCSTNTHLHWELREYDGKKWIHKNALIGTTHNRKWMNGFYYVKNSEGKWRIKVI